ncbi:MAG: FHA domain-containing protein [Chloroflexi bacterium]|nr:FHA domain-containing protein [Chloroflexota bacterium]
MSDDAPYLIDQAGRKFPLVEPITTMGRSAQCNVFIPDHHASRHHCEIQWDGDTCTLTDLGSANGTSVNGRRVTTPHTLRDGDEIAIASAVFIFHDPASTLRNVHLPLLVVDAATGEIWINRQPISLSPKEQALFDLLYQNKGRPCSKQDIAQAVWPEYQAEVYDYQIESLVKRVREKIETDPSNPRLILTVHGRGYKIVG